ncbi:MAG: HdeD family acid-resistance protein [Anaerorhabdus sp.]
MKILMFILGVITLVGGFYAMMAPGATFLSLGYIASILLISNGLSSVIYYFRNKKSDEVSFWLLVEGILTMGIGFMILGNATLYILSDIFIAYAFTTWLIITGVVQIGRVVTLKKANEKWFLNGIVALLTLIMGIYSFFNVGFTAITVGMMMGFWLLVQGINMIVIAFSIKGR